MTGLRGWWRLPSVAAVLLLSAAAFGAPAAGQFAETEKVIEKPSKEGEGRKLDASGLTNAFALLVDATRSIDRAEVGGGMVEVNAGRLPLLGVDWEALREHEQGLFEFQTAAAIKLRTEADIVVGDLEVPAGNVSPGFAGLYSLWLRLDDDGQWVLIVNHEPDVWGTMRDPAKDVGEIRLEHSIVEGGKPRLTIEIEPPEGDTPGTLRLSWGEHLWRTTVAASSRPRRGLSARVGLTLDAPGVSSVRPVTGASDLVHGVAWSAPPGVLASGRRRQPCKRAA